MNDILDIPEIWNLDDPVIGIHDLYGKDNEQFLACDSLNYYLSSPRSNSPLSEGYYSSSVGNSSDFDVGSICSDVKNSFSGDPLDDDESFCSVPFRRSSNDDELSLWSNDSLSMTSNFAEFSPNDSFSTWDYFDEQISDKPPKINQGQLNPSVSVYRNTPKSTEIIFQPVVIPTPTNLIQMTVISPETSVHEAIKAAGIGGNYSSQIHMRQEPSGTKQFFIMKQPQMTVFPISSVVTSSITIHNQNPSIDKVDDKDEDWDKDMPMLTPEEPFQQEQLSSSRSFELEQFYCSICKRELRSRHALMKHVKLHGVPKYKCNRCDKQFFDRTKLRRHQNVHSAEKKFRCMECQKSFTLENLKIHTKICHFSKVPAKFKEGFLDSRNLETCFLINAKGPESFAVHNL
ncbi:hypothetical protein FO519_006208 [Halicephalobus sp. NKZ332]|nr:hypothetical protein FO519_006208 [Halicephalobus sp. NKZ332]